MDLDNTDATTSAEDDLRASIESAFDTPDTPDTPAEPETESEKAERLRDERGRFAKSENTEAPEQPATPEAQAAPQDSRPASWKKEWGDWSKVSPDIQKIFLEREADSSKGVQSLKEQVGKYKPWEQVEQLLANDIAKWQMQGVSAPQLVERLVNAHRLLENPQTRDQAWQFLAQQYGPPSFYQQPVANQFQQQQYQQPYTNPVYDQKLAQLEGYLRQQQETALMSQIETFAKGHSYFEKAAEDIEKLLRQGAASTLEEAYDIAVWRNPEIRQQMLEDQAKEQVAKTAQDTSRAKKAASSVTGAPTGNAPTGAKASLREELEAAFERF